MAAEDCPRRDDDRDDARLRNALKILSERPFSKADMDARDTSHRLSADVLRTLTEYYVPCKARKYLAEEMSNQRCITVLRQVLRLHGYQLLSKQVYIGNGVPKQVIYWVGLLGSAGGDIVLHAATPPLDYRKMLSQNNNAPTQNDKPEKNAARPSRDHCCGMKSQRTPTTIRFL